MSRVTDFWTWLRGHVAREIVALAIALVTLTVGAGAIGWAIGSATSGEPRTVTVNAPTTTSGSTTTESTTTSDTTAGKAVFTSAGCGSCHALKAAGASGSVGPDLDTIALDSSAIRTVVANGAGAMPGFSGRLSEQEIADVADFVAQAGK